ncbi:hypothetical protein IKF57_02205 [Candidatus Saccharibacteria bacterium]|nr:hypothetical protein [Candidatus Saccharibacteria bacterium]
MSHRKLNEESKAKMAATREQHKNVVSSVLKKGIGGIATPKDYWEACLALTYVAGHLAHHDKALMTYRDKSKRFNVKHIIEKTGEIAVDVRNAKNDRIRSMKDFWQIADTINWYAEKRGMSQVSFMKFIGLLEDNNVREIFRKHITKHVETEHPPFELDELPDHDFTESDKKKLPYYNLIRG